MSVSPLTYLSTHPKARLTIYGVLLALGGGLLGWRIVQERSRRRSWRYRLPREARKISKQARVTTGKALHKAGSAIAGMPVVSDLPMFHKRSLPEKIGDALSGWWAGALAMLPFRRRQTFRQRIANRMPEVHVPDVHIPKVDMSKVRVPDVHLPEMHMPDVHMPEIHRPELHMPKNISMPWSKRKSFADKITVIDERKKVGRRVAKATEKAHRRISDHRKDVARAVDKAMTRSKSMAEKSPVIERHESVTEKVTFRK
jgi:hypothetical protein